MASREEEKRLRREERQATEAAAASQHNRAKRLQFLIGALLTIAVVVGAVFFITRSGGDDEGGTKPATPADGTAAKIPATVETNLEKAAAAADCELSSPDLESSTHVTEKVKYKSNPPTSGNHNPVAADDGIYETGQEPEPESYVHALEHGRVNIQYRKGTSKEQVAQLETLASEELSGKAAYKVLLFQNNTDMPYAVAATAWGQLIGCQTFTPKIFDALRAFRVKYVDKGPEPGIPPTN